MTMLSEVTQRLYETFSPYRVGDDFVGCECCVSPNESVKLASTPLPVLTYDDLRKQRLMNAYWDYGARPHGEVLRWLGSPEVSDYLANADLPEDFKPAKHQLAAVRAALGKVTI